jgi:hypothetical protein
MERQKSSKYPNRTRQVSVHFGHPMQAVCLAHFKPRERLEIAAEDVSVRQADATVKLRGLLASETLAFAKQEFGVATSVFIIGCSNVHPIKTLNR